MYATGEIIWDNDIVKNIPVALFSQGFLNLLTRSASVQATQLSNLFMTVRMPDCLDGIEPCNAKGKGIDSEG